MVSSSALPPDIERGVVTNVLQGDCLVSDAANVTFSTVLGSCISACVRDRLARVGGMNHFLLAEQSGVARDRYGASARYGAYAMERLINTVLSRGSGSKENLEIKVFGGGLIGSILADIGAKNIDFVRDFIASEGYTLSAEDLGGSYARRVLFRPHSGRAFVRRLAGAEVASVARAELASAHRPVLGTPSDIELF